MMPDREQAYCLLLPGEIIVKKMAFRCLYREAETPSRTG